MQEQIIACIDGSASSLAVSQWTAWLRPRLAAPVKLLHVLEKPAYPLPPDLSGNIGFDSREALLAELVQLDEQRNRIAHEHGKQQLATARQTVLASEPADGALPVKTCLRHGELLSTLVELEPEARLVIMGRQGELSATRHGQVGSQLESVARVLHTPILVTLPTFKAPHKVMFAYDGSETGRKALQRLTLSPLLQGLECDLVMVGGEAQALSEAQGLLQSAGLAVTPYHLQGDVQSVLEQHIQSRQIDLVIMGAYGHSRLRQFFLGSHTGWMLSHSPVPLLLLR